MKPKSTYVSKSMGYGGFVGGAITTSREKAMAHRTHGGVVVPCTVTMAQRDVFFNFYFLFIYLFLTCRLSMEMEDEEDE